MLCDFSWRDTEEHPVKAYGMSDRPKYYCTKIQLGEISEFIELFLQYTGEGL